MTRFWSHPFAPLLSAELDNLADADDVKGGESDRLTSLEKKELAELRRRNRQLKTETGILKRAAACFVRENDLPRVIYSLVRELAADSILVAADCRVLNVSTAGYYAWFGRPELPRALRNKELTKTVRQIRGESRGSYGLAAGERRVALGLGDRVNRKLMEQLMRQAGLQGVYRRRGRRKLVNALPSAAATAGRYSSSGLGA
ncbi:hypothetical protein [Actinomadura napierensis]|uniref:IS3 family transposase n=1 Tax=Actinomadura napierensis TaxID=267854 RepID=A0ABN2YBQ4_9ACTN